MTLLTKELSGPNGIAFSPDERYLYVDNWDLERKVLMRYEVNADGTIASGQGVPRFHPAPGASGARRHQGGRAGNVYVSAPGGVWILSPEGKAARSHRSAGARRELRLRAMRTDESLYLTASTGLYRIRLSVPGVRPGMAQQSAAR